jgi:hypothetical protein
LYIIRLQPSRIGMIVDRGHDFPPHIQDALDSYGQEMWLFRDDKSRGTTRALNAYRGEERGYFMPIFMSVLLLILL